MKICKLPISQICQFYHLGFPLQLDIIPGGLLSQVYYFKTSEGEFALKRIKTDTLVNLNLLSQDQTQTVACYLKERRIPTIVALQQNHHYSLRIASYDYMVFPWVSGKVIDASQITPKQAKTIGNLLAQIQTVEVKGDFKLPNWVGMPKQGWQALLKPLCSYHLPIMNTLEAAVDQLTRWSERASAAKKHLESQLVVSHRDFDAKNVIWSTPTTPILIDWEYAGYIHPTLDLLIVALNWSDVLSGDINSENFCSVIKGYQEQKKEDLPPLFDWIWDGYFGYCLDWIIYNISRILKDTQASYNISQSLLALCAVEHLQQQLTIRYNQEII